MVQVVERQDRDANWSIPRLEPPPPEASQRRYHSRQHEERLGLRLAGPRGRHVRNTRPGGWRLGRGFGVPKFRHVAAYRQQDHPWVGPAFAAIVFGEARAEPPGFRPHDGIAPRIVIGAPPEDFDRDYGFLQVAVVPLQAPLHHEPEQARELLAAGKKGARQDAFQFPTDGVTVRRCQHHCSSIPLIFCKVQRCAHLVCTPSPHPCSLAPAPRLTEYR